MKIRKLDLLKERLTLRRKKMGLEDKVQRFIVTSAQYNAGLNDKVWKSMQRFADNREASIKIMPTSGKNISEDELHPDLQQYEIITGKEIINSNLKLQNLQVRSNQINPLTGVQHFARDDRSLIFGSPKQALSYVSNHKKSFPKALTTTGTVTLPNYNDRGRINEIARNDHTYGFVYVEVEDDKHFHFRHIKARKNGKFNDLTGSYTPNTHNPTPKTEALIVGDLHAQELDPKHKENTFKQIENLQPKHLFLHDVFDGYSINHWIKDHYIQTQRAYDKQGLNLEKELKHTADVLNEYATAEGLRGNINVVYSNHDDRLYRWLDEGEFLKDKGNSKIGALLFAEALEGKNPLEAGLNLVSNLSPNIKFLEPDSSYQMRGFELAMHGHEKTKGGRSSVRSIENALGKSVTGHTHSSFIIRDTYKVGTSTPLDLEYTNGFGNWTQTNGALYSTEQVQLLNTINGKSSVDE